jgi:hypothetical protein
LEQPRGIHRGAAAACLLLLSAACAHSAGAHQSADFAARIGGIHRAALLQPKVRAFEIAAGEAPVEKEEWTALYRSNASAAVIARFRATGIEVTELSPVADAGEVSEVDALSEAVMASVFQYVYFTPFPEKVKRFDYSLGPLGPLLDREAADALVVVWGSALVPTLGRQVLNAIIGGPPQQARLAVAIVDRSGSLLWYNYAHAAGEGDYSNMTDAAAVDAMVKTALTELSARTPQR